MNIETLVTSVVAYAIGFYVMLFFTGMWNSKFNIKFDLADFGTCVLWPFFISVLVVIGLMLGLSKLYELASAKVKSKFPPVGRFGQRTLKCARTVIFAVSLVFRPVKLGEVVEERIRR